MNFLTVFGIAVGLAMDAFSVCIVAGCCLSKISYRHYFRLAFHFGLFQFLMPIAGYYAGVLVESFIRNIDHWIALGLLSFVGGKMIWESFKHDDEQEEKPDPSRGGNLVMLSIATSIDAAAVGFSLAALEISVFGPALLIGVVCAAFSIMGIFLGSRIGRNIGAWAERLGGVILIGIGIKILIEHVG